MITDHLQPAGLTLSSVQLSVTQAARALDSARRGQPTLETARAAAERARADLTKLLKELPRA